MVSKSRAKRKWMANRCGYRTKTVERRAVRALIMHREGLDQTTVYYYPYIQPCSWRKSTVTQDSRSKCHHNKRLTLVPTDARAATSSAVSSWPHSGQYGESPSVSSTTVASQAGQVLWAMLNDHLLGCTELKSLTTELQQRNW